MNTKKILIATGVSALLLGTLSFAAVNGHMQKGDKKEIQTAIESNNYSGLSAETKVRISENEFQRMVTKNANRKTIETTLTTGDYTAYKNAMIAQIPTETEFQEMAKMHQSRAIAQTAIATAIKNNDFTAFKAAIATMDALRPDNSKGEDRPTPTDAQLQKRFDKLVSQYKTDGTLPSPKGPGFGGMMMGQDGPMGGFGGHKKRDNRNK